MRHRQAVTKARARAYARAERAKKTMILDELVELTGWHRDYALPCPARRAVAHSPPFATVHA